MATKLYVGNLTFNTTENELQDYFAGAGTVSEVAILQDKMTGRSRGFGFITMGSEEEARKAEQLFNGKEFQGRALVVNEATPREDRPRGGGGGGGGGFKKSYGGGGGGGGGRRNNY